MTSTYSTSLRLELMATGDQSGTWGDTTNTNLGTLLEQAITGVLSLAMADANQTLTNLNGASDQSRNAVIVATGALTAGRNIVVPAVNKLYLVRNSTTGGFNVTVKTPSGTGIAVVPGTARLLYCDGTNVNDGSINLQTLTTTALSPTTSDGLALGTGTLMWSDLFLASGGVINFNNGNVTLTHSAGALTFAGVTSGITSDGPLNLNTTGVGAQIVATSTDAGASAAPSIDLYRNSASPAASDSIGQIVFNGQNSTPAKKTYASITGRIDDATAASEDATLIIATMKAGTLTNILTPGANAAGTATANAIGLPLGQLSFPASQNSSSDANTLDDYEEFTATATAAFSTVGTSSWAYTTQAIAGTKIGDLVSGYYVMDITPTIGTGSSNLNISGFPYTVATFVQVLPVSNTNASWSWTAGRTQITGNISTSSVLTLVQIGTAAAANTIGASNMTTGASHTFRASYNLKVA